MSFDSARLKQKIPMFVLMSYAVVEFILMFIRPIQKGWGWDYQIYCKALDVLKTGQSPYLVKNLGTQLSYTYPPLAAYFFAPLCALPFYSYLVFQLVMILGLCGLLIKYLKFNPLRTFLFVAFAFNATKSNLMTGNLGLLEALAFVIFLVLSLKSESRLSYAANLGFGFMGYIKVLPVLFNLLSIFGNRLKDFKKTMVQVGTSGAVFSGLWIITLIFHSKTSMEFINLLLHGNNNQHNALTEVEANPSNPTLMLWFRNLNDYFMPHGSWIYILCLVGLLLLSILIFRRRVQRESDLVVKYAWLGWILVLWLPRYKEYSFVYSSIILLVLIEKKFTRYWVPVLLLTIFQRSLAGTYTQPWQNLLLNNSQTMTHFLLFIIFGLIKIEQPSVEQRPSHHALKALR